MTCEHCQQPFVRKKKKRDSVRFCSRACAFSAKAVGGWNRGLSKPKPVKVRTTYDRTCVQCGEAFTAKVLKAKLCSLQCSIVYFGTRKRDRSPRQCVTCGVVFIPTYGDKRRRFCSQKCSTRYGKRGIAKSHESRARRVGARCEYGIKPLEVLARDGWHCQICGCETPKHLRGTIDDHAPELDHIIPIGLGGGHTHDNVQCACRKCNGLKASTFRTMLCSMVMS